MVNVLDTPDAGLIVTFFELEGTKLEVGVKSIGNVSELDPS